MERDRPHRSKRPSLRLLTWNMGGFTPGLNSRACRADAWRLLTEVSPVPDVALLQEASAPPSSVLGDATGPSSGIDARIWSASGAITEAASLEGVREHGWLASGRIFTAAGPITFLSLHARAQGSVVTHIEALLEGAAGQLDGSFVLAGDFNSCRLAEQTWPGYRHLEFFEGAEERYGMVNCFWREHGREQRTYWKGCSDGGQPFQDDHIFVSIDLAETIRRCEVLDYEAFRGTSDHAPMALQCDLELASAPATRSSGAGM